MKEEREAEEIRVKGEENRRTRKRRGRGVDEKVKK